MFKSILKQKKFFWFFGKIFFSLGFRMNFFEKRVPKKSVFWAKITQNRSKWQKWSKSWKIGFRFRSLTAMYCPSMGFLPIYQPFLGFLARFSPFFAFVKCLWGSLRAFCDTFRCILTELAKLSTSVKIAKIGFRVWPCTSIHYFKYWFLLIPWSVLTFLQL